jgi:glycerol uptake facilitator protein
MHISPFIAELIGTAILVLLGDGVVANVLLARTKGNGSGWIVITFGWGMAVFVGVFCVSDYSGAHLNPAVTLAMAVAHRLEWHYVIPYMGAQMLGAMLGSTIVYLFYAEHFRATDDADLKLGVFCTAPNIRNMLASFVCEIIGTFVLVFPIFLMADPGFALDTSAHKVKMGLGALGALPVGLLVFSIGMSLGGTTGYAINPARDLGPRIMHAILPIPGKRDSDWGYSWVPVIGPLVGGLLAAAAAKAISPMS